MTPGLSALRQKPQTTIKGIIGGITTLLMGFLCCWTPLTAPLLTGWINRYMRNCALRVWIKKCAPETAPVKSWPKWLDDGAENTPIKPPANIAVRIWRKTKGAARSLGRLYRSGLLSLLNTWLLSLPFGFVWLWMWWAGWNNTFSRGYEEEGLTQGILFLSMLAFCCLMLYLPLAQARQAIQGTWQAFFDVQVIRTIAAHVRIRLLILALTYALIGGAVLLGGKAILATFPQVYGLEPKDTEMLKQKIFVHFFGMIAFFYGGLLFVKRMNARVYAIGLLKALQSGALNETHLGPYERSVLFDQLAFKRNALPKVSPRWKRVLGWPFKKIGIGLLILTTICVWGGMVSTLYFSQFMNHSYPDWLNLPLIQMPYIRVPEINPG